MFAFSQQSISDGNPIYGSRYKVVGDPVHRMITLDDALLQIIDTPVYQRLRDLKQLGTVYYVFPGGSHNRFEHSIGVAHLSSQMADFLTMSSPGINISEEEKLYIRIAGAVHDLGHGPFSHVWDGLFIPTARPGVNWSHEEMSLELLDILIDDNSIDILDGDPEGRGDYKYGRNMVKQMIMGAKPKSKGLLSMDDKPYLFEIVANGLTGIDTDKFDYLSRDTYNIGLQSSFDHKRLLYSAKVVGGHIAYHAKECLSVYELFHTRYMLFKQIYVHRATKAVELMVTDVMLEANAAWNGALAAAIDDPREYILQTDCLLREIERSKDPSLARARELLQDIRYRRLYRFVDEFLLPLDAMFKLKKVVPEDITAFNTDPSVNLDPKDVVVHDTKFNYGKGRENPVDSCIFYRDAMDDKGFHIKSERVSHMVPAHFEERVVRVYTKKSDGAYVNAVQKAFRRFLKVHLGPVPMAPDPSSKVYALPQINNAADEYGLHSDGVLPGDSGASGVRPHVQDHFDYDSDDRFVRHSQKSVSTRQIPMAPPVAVHGFTRMGHSPARTKSLTNPPSATRRSMHATSAAVAAADVSSGLEEGGSGLVFQLPDADESVAGRAAASSTTQLKQDAKAAAAAVESAGAGMKRQGSGIAMYFKRSESISTVVSDTQSSDTGNPAKRARPN